MLVVTSNFVSIWFGMYPVYLIWNVSYLFDLECTLFIWFGMYPIYLIWNVPCLFDLECTLFIWFGMYPIYLNLECTLFIWFGMYPVYLIWNVPCWQNKPFPLDLVTLTLRSYLALPNLSKITYILVINVYIVHRQDNL